MSKKELSYQAAADELSTIAKKLESDDVNIDDLEKIISRGRELIIFCNEKLRATQEKINDYSD